MIDQNLKSTFNQAVICYLDGDYLSAVKLFTDLAAKITLPEIYHSLGASLLKAGEEKSAQVNFQHALQLDNGYLPSLLALGRFFKNKKPSASKKYFSQAQKVTVSNSLFSDFPLSENKLRITYLMATTQATGGARVIFEHANRLLARGHEVHLLSYQGQPDWFPLKTKVTQIPPYKKLEHCVPLSDIIVSTYWSHAVSGQSVPFSIPVYFVQGDEYLFDRNFNPPYQQEADNSYKLPFKLAANSKAVQRIMKENYHRYSRVIPPGVDPTVFYPRPKERSAKKKILVVASDQLKFKGVDVILETLRKVQETNSNFDLFRVSPFYQEDYSFPCFYEERPSQERLGEIYAQCDILISGSFYEAFSLPPLEAMASGTSVITTANEGVKQYAEHGYNCLMVPVKDSDAMAEAVLHLLEDDTLRDKLSRNGLETARSFYWDRIIEQLEDFYLGLAEDIPFNFKLLDSVKAIQLGRKIFSLNKNNADYLPLLEEAFDLDEDYQLTKEELYATYWRLGDREFKDKNYPEARYYYGKALPYYRKSASLHNKIGATYYKENDYAEAFRFYERAVLLSPEEAEYYYDLGLCYFAAGDWQTAVENFQKCEILCPNLRKAYYGPYLFTNMVTCYNFLGRADLADQSAKKALRFFTDPTISLCMIVKNEEKELPECFASVKDLVSEIIIVDTGSTDRTVEVAKEHGAKVFFYEWNGDFAKARNYSLRQATSDWILVLDADERVAPDSVSLIKELVHTSIIKGYFVKFINFLKERDDYSAVLESVSMRLFPNHADLAFVRPVHEELTSINERTVFYKHLSDVKILHHGYLKEKYKEKAKENRNIEMLKKVVLTEPENSTELAYYYYHIALHYYDLGELTEAIKYFDMAKKYTRNFSQSASIPSIFSIAANCYLELGDLKMAEEEARFSLKYSPKFSDAHYTLGNIYYRSGNFPMAVQHYQLAIKYGDVIHFTSSDKTTGGWKPYCNLGRIYFVQQDFKKAVEFFKKAISLEPDEAFLYGNTAVSCFNLEDYAEAEKYYQKALAINPNNTDWLKQLTNIYEKTGRSEKIMDMMEKLYRQNKDKAFALGIAVKANQLGQYKKAVNYYNIYLNEVPQDGRVILDRGLCYLRLKALNKAMADFQAVAEIDPELLEVLPAKILLS